MGKKIKPTKKQLKIIKEYWEQLQSDYMDFCVLVSKMEDAMSKETGIKDLEFFMVDGDFVGVGTVDRSMELIHMDES